MNEMCSTQARVRLFVDLSKLPEDANGWRELPSTTTTIMCCSGHFTCVVSRALRPDVPHYPAKPHKQTRNSEIKRRHRHAP